LRVFLTFVLTVAVSGAVAGLLTFRLARAHGPAWFEPIFEMVEARNDEISATIDDPSAREALRRELERNLHARVAIHTDRRQVSRRLKDLPLGMVRRLRRGEPVVVPPTARQPPTLLIPLANDGVGHRGRLTAVVEVRPPRRGAAALVLVAIVSLTSLGVGAYVLSSFMTARLRRLQATTRRIAEGDLSTRAQTRDVSVPDELDDLALAFNHMAGRTERLVHGQKTLLTNVSHELRTPVARMKVLLEILGDRLDRVDDAEPDARAQTVEATFERVRRGMAELDDDLEEVEALIADLLTSGRMELGRDGALALERVDVQALLERVGPKHDAKTRCDPPKLEATLDVMLIERVLSNLLANARRAAPNGALLVSAQLRGSSLLIAVDDEGPGVEAHERERIFEAFTRLDEARARDQGGAGLGLYLCRQIAKAHGGEIIVTDRLDEARGARFELTLPLEPA